MILTYIIKKNTYTNLKQILKEELNMSDRLITKLKRYHSIFLNHAEASIHSSVQLGDFIECHFDWSEENANIIPNKMDLDILYEDDSLLVINKPPYLAVHPSCNHFFNSLSNGVRFYFDEIGLKKKIRPVNRLDKDTSGIVIFAKNEYIQESLIRQMKNKTFQKKYYAIVEGILEEKHGTIHAPIKRKADSIIERCIHLDGETAITHYKVVKEYSTYSLLSCLLETGRTHQIRVHCKYIGHPIIGDTLYGSPSPFIARQALHAYEVSFIHPITKEPFTITAALPKDIRKVLNL